MSDIVFLLKCFHFPIALRFFDLIRIGGATPHKPWNLRAYAKNLRDTNNALCCVHLLTTLWSQTTVSEFAVFHLQLSTQNSYKLHHVKMWIIQRNNCSLYLDPSLLALPCQKLSQEHSRSIYFTREMEAKFLFSESMQSANSSFPDLARGRRYLPPVNTFLSQENRTNIPFHIKCGSLKVLFTLICWFGFAHNVK